MDITIISTVPDIIRISHIETSRVIASQERTTQDETTAWKGAMACGIVKRQEDYLRRLCDVAVLLDLRILTNTNSPTSPSTRATEVTSVSNLNWSDMNT